MFSFWKKLFFCFVYNFVLQGANQLIIYQFIVLMNSKVSATEPQSYKNNKNNKKFKKYIKWRKNHDITTFCEKI